MHGLFYECIFLTIGKTNTFFFSKTLEVRQISHDINIHALKLSQFVLHPKISVELQDRIIYMRHLFFPFHFKNIDDSKM